MKDKEYSVSWTIDIIANSPKSAAQQAHDIMIDPSSIANVFDVFDTETKKQVMIDLTEENNIPIELAVESINSYLSTDDTRSVSANIIDDIRRIDPFDNLIE